MRRIVLSALIVTLFSGCAAAPLVLVGVGAVGGYAASKDTFEGNTTRTQEELWDASNKVLAIMGTIDSNDQKRGEITALVNGAKVWLTIVPINLSTSKLRIRARKNLLPAIGIAQEIYTKIINQLE